METNLSPNSLDSKSLVTLTPDAFDALFDNAPAATSIPGVVQPTKELSELVGQTIVVVAAKVKHDTQYGDVLVMLCLNKQREVFQVPTTAGMVLDAIQNIPADRFPVKISIASGSGKGGTYYYLA